MIKLHRRIIETERMYLQPYALKHADTLFHLIHKNKPGLLHSFPKLLYATENRDATKDFVQQKIFDWNKNKAFALLLFNKENHQLIGHLNVKDIDWKLLQCELAYFIDEDFKKQGLITEALNRVLKICFEELKLRHVSARIVTTNIASVKVVEKAGLKYEGAFYKDYTTYDNKIVDTYRYGISKEDYTRKTK
ncbi:MAG: acetyltransferase, family [Bacteroidota bacterium]|nr:acetyltransferase, family [Bacteroidota bacterium]